MNYGYFNAYITDIGEDVPQKVDIIRQYTENVFVESLSYRPELNDLIENILKEGDTLYVYSFSRFSSGLRDLDALLTEIVDERKVNVISITDEFDSSTEEGKGARKAFGQAVKLIVADPNYGFYK